MISHEVPDDVMLKAIEEGHKEIKKICKFIEKMKEEMGYHYLIEVDGGINDQTIQQVADAGTDIAVAGSFIFENNTPKQQIQTLQDLI